MELRIAQEKDYWQIAEMKWLHCEEDEVDYHTNHLQGVDKAQFLEAFVEFLKVYKAYKVFVACEDEVVVSSMFAYVIPKTPKPNRKQKYIAYLTNVYTLKEYRNKKIGTELLTYVKAQLTEENCELLFVWPSEKSVDWYARNDFKQENEIWECELD